MQIMIYYQIYDGREKILQGFLIQNPKIEKTLLKEDKQFFIERILYGSWILTIWAKTQKAYKAI
jgi:hypothetical protein